MTLFLRIFQTKNFALPSRPALLQLTFQQDHNNKSGSKQHSRKFVPLIKPGWKSHPMPLERWRSSSILKKSNNQSSLLLCLLNYKPYESSFLFGSPILSGTTGFMKGQSNVDFINSNWILPIKPHCFNTENISEFHARFDRVCKPTCPMVFFRIFRSRFFSAAV